MGTRIYYRTKDGQADYRFSIELRSNGYRVYILEQPSYRGRSESAWKTHRLSHGSPKYICWTERIRSEEEAKAIAANWADRTQEYIRTGHF